MATIREVTAGQAWLVTGMTLDGQQIRKRFSRSKYASKAKQMAEAFRDQISTEKRGVADPVINRIIQETRKIEGKQNYTFRQLAEYYRDEHLKVKTKSYEGMKSHIGTLILKWGDYRWDQITKKMFSDWLWYALKNPIKSLRGETRYAPSSVEKLWDDMLSIYNECVRAEMVPHNPLLNLQDPALRRTFKKLKNKDKTCLNLDEFWNFILWEKVTSHLRNASICSWCTGMRREEVCILTWKHIHGFEIIFEAWETKEGIEKHFYADPELYDLMKQIEEWQVTVHGKRQKYVFLGYNGEQYKRETLTKDWEKYRKQYAIKSGIEKYVTVVFHSIRASYVTRKFREGFDAKTIMKNVGHHIVATSDHYNIVDKERQMEMAGIVEKLPESIQNIIDDLTKKCKEQGYTLTDIQPALRKSFLTTNNNFRKLFLGVST